MGFLCRYKIIGIAALTHEIITSFEMLSSINATRISDETINARYSLFFITLNL